MNQFDTLIQKLLLESPLLNKDLSGELYQKDEKGSVIKPDSFSIPEDSSKIGELQGHDILYKYEKNPYPFVVINVVNPNNVSTLELVLEPTKEKDTFRERQVESAKDNRVKSFNLYHYLITVLGYSIISDNEQTLGGQKIWLNLFQKTDIKFFSAFESKIKSPNVNPISEWKPLKKSDLKDISSLWSDDPKKFQATVIIKATKK